MKTPTIRQPARPGAKGGTDPMPSTSLPFRRWSLSGAVEALARIGPAWIVVAASLALSLLGISAIDVAEPINAAQRVAGLGPTASRQLMFLAISAGAALLIALPNYRWLAAASWFFYAAGLAALIFLLLPFVPWTIVAPRNGARSWINLGFTDLQPSEPVKIAYAMTLAWYMRYRTEHRSFSGLIPPAIITAIPIALIMLQPDLGTATLFVPALFAVLISAGARLRHLAIIVMLASLAAPAAYPLLKPHQQQRIAGLLKQFQGDTSEDQDLNFQSSTAQTMIAAGRVSGLDRDHAQSLLHYNRLPERHNDMIVAVIAARHGLLGGILLLAIYLVWFAGALVSAAMTKDPFGRLLIVALAAFIAAQVFVNVGMNVGLLPIIGITLPYVSYGGSSLVTVWLMTGLIVNVVMRRPRVGPRRSFEFFDE
jgi:rod shape determining protein RodA